MKETIDGFKENGEALVATILGFVIAIPTWYKYFSAASHWIGGLIIIPAPVDTWRYLFTSILIGFIMMLIGIFVGTFLCYLTGMIPIYIVKALFRFGDKHSVNSDTTQREDAPEKPVAPGLENGPQSIRRVMPVERSDDLMKYLREQEETSAK